MNLERFLEIVAHCDQKSDIAVLAGGHAHDLDHVIICVKDRGLLLVCGEIPSVLTDSPQADPKK